VTVETDHKPLIGLIDKPIVINLYDSSLRVCCRNYTTI